jgi:hypothetical protein
LCRVWQLSLQLQAMCGAWHEREVRGPTRRHPRARDHCGMGFAGAQGGVKKAATDTGRDRAVSHTNQRREPTASHKCQISSHP